MPVHYLKYAVFVLLALTVAFRARWGRDRRFSINPLDLLVVVAAVVVPNLPGMVTSPRELSAAVVKLVLLLYGLESLIVTGTVSWRWLSAGMSVFLLSCEMTGLLR